MSYKIIDCDFYKLIKFTGKTSLIENESARNELISELNDKPLDSVLVDMSDADLSEVTLEKLVEFGEGWEVSPIVSNTKFATVVPENNSFRAKVDLSLSTGLYHGVQLKVFQSKNSAISWLKP